MRQIGYRVVGMLLAAVLLAGCTPHTVPVDAPVPVITPAPTPIPTPAPTPEPTPEPDRTVTLLAAGDNLIHDAIYQQAGRRAAAVGRSGYDFTFAYEHVAPYIEAADIAILNQETPIVPSRMPATYPCFNSPPELGEHMRAIGFDIFSLSNNHILDQGSSGREETADYWAQFPEVAVSGLYPQNDPEAGITLWEQNGITFAFLAFTEHTNGIVQRVEAESRAVIYTYETERMQQLVQRAAELADTVVVSVHWGIEGTHTVTAAQRSLAHSFADWGADIILGSHPHVLQPTELITVADGREVPVIYSLGNFISAQSSGANMVSVLAELTITKPADGSPVRAAFTNMIPLVTHYEAGMRDVTVYPLAKYHLGLCEQHGVRQNTPEFSLAYLKEIVTNNLPVFE